MKIVVHKRLFFIIVICMVLAQGMAGHASENGKFFCENVISIALDVSGSMKATDVQRYSLDLIGMILDTCQEDVMLNVTLYNDSVVYNSGLFAPDDDFEKQKVISRLNDTEFKGETDNGLGLLTATNMIVDSGVDYDNAFVILISDGNTDLENSLSTRTKEDSDSDIKAAGEIAEKKGIRINVVEYTDEYNLDTGLFSIVSSSTGGAVTIVDNPMQFIQVVMDIFVKQYTKKDVTLEITESESLIQKHSVDITTKENQKCLDIVFSTEPIESYELINQSHQDTIYKGRYYLVQEVDRGSTCNSKMMYSVEGKTTIIHMNVIVDYEVTADQTIKPVEKDNNKPPKGNNVKKQVYESEQKLSLDVSEFFYDVDNDIVLYQIDEKNKTKRCTLSGSMLSIDISSPGTVDCKVRAIDSKKNKETIEFSLVINSNWDKYHNIIVTAIVVIIVIVTVVISILIIRKILFVHEKKNNRINGVITARFIDLKSKNEAMDIQWDLINYPPDGVTLEELLGSVGIKENLNDADKICFYPSKKNYELILVHCMNGGVFIGNSNVRPNRPLIIKSGDIIYISFDENASEIELRYTMGVMD